MRQREEWKSIEGFPNYAISSEGRVMNRDTELIKVHSPNQQGIPSVNLIEDGKQNRRSVAVLVAHHFLEPHPNPNFDTPIHLNGDRMDCSVDNLAWRPRWFAIKYHSQFHNDRRGFPVPVYCVETDEVFNTSWDAAIKYGLIDKDIPQAVLSGYGVFPLGYEFEVI